MDLPPRNRRHLSTRNAQPSATEAQDQRAETAHRRCSRRGSSIHTAEHQDRARPNDLDRTNIPAPNPGRQIQNPSLLPLHTTHELQRHNPRIPYRRRLGRDISFNKPDRIRPHPARQRHPRRNNLLLSRILARERLQLPLLLIPTKQTQVPELEIPVLSPNRAPRLRPRSVLRPRAAQPRSRPNARAANQLGQFRTLWKPIYIVRYRVRRFCVRGVCELVASAGGVA